MREVLITLTALLTTACSRGEGGVQCGSGTVLKNGACEVAPIIAQAGDASVLQDAKADPDARSGSATSALKASWTYATVNDAMRGTKTEQARIASTNTVNFGAPYGASHLVLVLQHSTDGDLVVLLVESGQFECAYSGCAISYKVDDHKVEDWLARESDRGSATLVLSGKAAWLGKIRDAKHLVVEAGFFREGREQFQFDIAGLDWKYMPAVPKPAASRGYSCDNEGDGGRCYPFSGARDHDQPKAWCYGLDDGQQLCWMTPEICDHFRMIAAADTTACKEVR